MAVIDKVQIGNLALANIGSGATIEDFNEQSIEAKQIKLWYDIARKQSLEAYNWNFARKKQALALHSEEADLIDWAFRYQYPVDCVKLRHMLNPAGRMSDAVPYEVEIATDGTKSIVTNLEDAVAVYTFDQDDTTVYSITFINALAFILAHYISFVLTEKQSIADRNLQKFYTSIRIAASQATNEEVPAEPRDTDWIRTRA